MLGGFAGGPGRVRAGAVRRCRYDQRFPNGLNRRAGACSFPTFFLPGIWPRKTAIFNLAIQSPSGVAGPLGNSRFGARFLLGAERVFAIDQVSRSASAWPRRVIAETINYEDVGVYDTLMENTGGLGPDSCIDAVGLEAHVLWRDWRLRSRETGDDVRERPAPRVSPGASQPAEKVALYRFQGFIAGLTIKFRSARS